MKIKKQTDSNECGLVCLQAIFKYLYGYWVSLSDLKLETNFLHSGVSITELKNTAQKFNINLQPMEGDWVSFKNLTISEPLLLLVNKSGILHYVIVENKNKKFIEYLDPVEGKIRKTLEEFSLMYLGVIIKFSKQKYSVNSLANNKTKHFIANNWKIIVFNSAFSIFIFIISIVFSLFTKNIINKISLKQNYDVLIYCLILLWLLVNKILFEFCESLISKKYFYQIFSQYFSLLNSKIQKAKLSEINKLKKEDLMQKYVLIEQISGYISTKYTILFSESLILIFSLAYLGFQNIYFFASILIILALIFIVSIFKSKFLKKYYENHLNIANKKMASILNICLNGENIKNSLFSTHLFNAVNQDFISYLNSDYKISKNGMIISKIISFLTAFLPILIFATYTFIYKKSSVSVGDILFYTTFFNFLINPSVSIASLISDRVIYKENLDKINFVFKWKEEKQDFTFSQIASVKNIRTSNLVFGYVPSKPIFNIPNLLIENKNILEGKNGCGKSSFLKLLTKYYDYEGLILFNNVNIQNIDTQKIRTKVSYISQECFFIDGSIYKNITFLDPELEQNFKINYQKYNLEALFKYLGLQLDSQITNNGENLSFGQKQFINILRIFAKTNIACFLDEAFENIDSFIFKWIKNMLLVELKDCLVIEISHSKKYIFNDAKRINFDSFKVQ